MTDLPFILEWLHPREGWIFGGRYVSHQAAKDAARGACYRTRVRYDA